ncbi:hypothetical protein Tco_0908787 [Tanacetum coccineum]|uniref:Uncharacterized protein n=1 Tax=Tanacetum coccineum TaxID=301880 RepID=A0ABQ5CQ18_9ASTR
MQEAVVQLSVQLKYDRIREESSTANQQFLETIDDGMKKIIKEHVKKEVSKIIPKVEKFVNDRLESEDIQRSALIRTLVEAYEVTRFLLDTLWRIQSQEGTRCLPVLQVETTTKTAGQTTDFFDVLEKTCRPGVCNRCVQVEQADEEVQHLPDWKFDLNWEIFLLRRVYKATTEKLDWINPEGRQYPHDLRQPLPLVPNSQGRRVIPFHHFINNDLEYLRGGVSSRKYSTSVTKTKAADYGHVKWIEDLVPNSMWSQTIVKYDKFALWGISHWGKKRRQFYAFATLRESARDVYSKRRIIAVTKVEIVEWHDYKHLDWITVRRDDDALYKFKEGDLHRLRIQDIEDMLLLLVQGKVTNLSVEERIAFNVSLRMFTRRVVSSACGMIFIWVLESYQKKT